MSKASIYRITNTINGKIYIGSTKHLVQKRWDRHKRYLRGNYHINRHLQNAWNKYGPDVFLFEVIEMCEPEVQFEREQVHMDASGCLNKEIGYNKALTAGGGNTGNHPSGEDHGRAVLTEVQVSEIKTKLLEDASHVELASAHGVCRSTISEIWRGIIWRGISDPKGWSDRDLGKHRLSQEQAQEALSLLDQGLTQKETAKRCRLSLRTVSRIKNRRGRWSCLD